MNEEQLANLIRKTVLEWAMEEYLANQDSESSLKLHERYEENTLTFMQNLKEKLGDDLAHLQELST